ncbi:MAG: rRNA maturation RNase YbeY [Roseovarius sp.]|nr:rRNA maturation RNase YbeY [Roseovarius sp.]MCY4290288.1 rRNA maturation RNase YbeY [Roseovarius sp.]
MLTETIVEDERWVETGLPELAERAAKSTLRHLGLTPDQWSIGILGCDDNRMSKLNFDFLGKSRSTNVLSWPVAERSAIQPGSPPPAPEPDNRDLGDIAIAYEYCATEAINVGRSLEDHVAHLVVHAVLHLLGYDHVNDKDAALMENLEREILVGLNVNTLY